MKTNYSLPKNISEKDGIVLHLQISVWTHKSTSTLRLLLYVVLNYMKGKWSYEDMQMEKEEVFQ